MMLKILRLRMHRVITTWNDLRVVVRTIAVVMVMFSRFSGDFRLNLRKRRCQ